MKKYLSIALLISALAWPAYAWWAIGRTGGVIPAATGDSCTGALKLSAHFENSDTITSGTPAGCNSNADQTWTIQSNVTYVTTNNPADAGVGGSYNMRFNNGGATNGLASISADCSGSAGTFSFDIYAVTAPLGLKIFQCGVDADNYMKVMFDVSDSRNLQMVHMGGGSSQSAASTGNLLTTGAWHHVIGKWSSAGVSGHTLSITIDSTTATADNALGSFTGTPTDVSAGADWQTYEFFVDNFKIYNTWQ